jgi:acyl carrier protein
MSQFEVVIGILAEAIEVDPSELNPESELRSFPTFDSIGILTLIGLLEDRLHFVLDPERIPDLLTVHDFYSYIEQSS